MFCLIYVWCFWPSTNFTWKFLIVLYSEKSFYLIKKKKKSMKPHRKGNNFKYEIFLNLFWKKKKHLKSAWKVCSLFSFFFFINIFSTVFCTFCCSLAAKWHACMNIHAITWIDAAGCAFAVQIFCIHIEYTSTLEPGHSLAETIWRIHKTFRIDLKCEAQTKFC